MGVVRVLMGVVNLKEDLKIGIEHVKEMYKAVNYTKGKFGIVIYILGQIYDTRRNLVHFAVTDLDWNLIYFDVKKVRYKELGKYFPEWFAEQTKENERLGLEWG